ncbi:hypothetical protein [Burkholderia ubonensis]|uniref:hypothetical protein n=1 Tax=Burkholderia ubonensis TaxID=101571 RepID=UPI001161264A|nr:hypothetical protein [Burkholderia ubonensis]
MKLTKEERFARYSSQAATLRRHIQRCDPTTQQDVIERLRRECEHLEKKAKNLDPNKPKVNNSPKPKEVPKTRQELLLEQIRREHGPNVQIEFIVEPSQPRSVWTTAQAGGPGTGKRR